MATLPTKPTIPDFLKGDLSGVAANYYLSDFADRLQQIEWQKNKPFTYRDPTLFIDPVRAVADMMQHRTLWVATYSSGDCQLFSHNRIARMICGLKPDRTLRCPDIRLLPCLHSKLFLGVDSGKPFCAYVGSYNCVKATTLNLTIRIDAPERVAILTEYYEMLWKTSKPLKQPRSGSLNVQSSSGK